MTGFQETSDHLCERVAAQNNGTCLLAFSGGKDAICSYLQCKKYFKKIVPYYLYLVPKLGFVERSLAYYEQKMQCKITRLPHPSFYRMLNSMVFQSPENVKPILRAKLPNFSYKDVYRIMREDFKLAEDCPVASGVRACDSPIRRIGIIKRGAYVNDVFLPVFDWNKAKVIETIQESGWKLPSDYRVFGRSFDGLDYRFLSGIKNEWPEDYNKILEWFPMADLEVQRRQYRKEHFNGIRN